MKSVHYVLYPQPNKTLQVTDVTKDGTHIIFSNIVEVLIESYCK